VIVNDEASEAASEDEEGGAWEFTQTQPEAFFAAPDLMPQEDTKAKAKSTSSVRIHVDHLRQSFCQPLTYLSGSPLPSVTKRNN
jgi:hypothetical protein